MRRCSLTTALSKALAIARVLAAFSMLVASTSRDAFAERERRVPILHEPIASDPRDDLALAITLPGDIPAALQTPRGILAAPDPLRPLSNSDPSPYGAARAARASSTPSDTFVPDRNTKRPDSLPYDEPFSPSTAPFKRLGVFDAVNEHYTLSVARPLPTILPIEPSLASNTKDPRFYADMVVDLSAGDRVRIPSVGAGARVVHARAGVGTRDIAFSLSKDGAENWFIESPSTIRARLVMELSVPRAAFGGDYGDPRRSSLRPVAALPRNVEHAAREVAEHLGLSKQSTPREIVSRLVAHFRAFQESEEPPPSRGDIYRDLALGKRGVCRHRAFAFLVTALYLGIPTRMVTNEAHAWVEVDDGRAWRRIDLGGAGRMLQNPQSSSIPFEPPPDPFPWPSRATRGEDLVAPRHVAPFPAPTLGSAAAAASAAAPSDASDARPPSSVTLKLSGTEARRGAPLPFSGTISAEGAPCASLPVEIFLRTRSGESIPIGALSTNDQGAFAGAFVLPPSVPLGDYEAHARTLGDKRCGRGETH